jgi:hypothetical protein
MERPSSGRLLNGDEWVGRELAVFMARAMTTSSVRSTLSVKI